MQALKVPKGVVEHIDKMRRSFLWKDDEACHGINCQVNWEKVCTRKRTEGLGIIDLICQNNALLTKWLWIINRQPEGLWASTLRNLYGITDASQVGSATQASFFLKDLAELMPFFSASAQLDHGGSG